MFYVLVLPPRRYAKLLEFRVGKGGICVDHTHSFVVFVPGRLKHVNVRREL